MKYQSNKIMKRWSRFEIDFKLKDFTPNTRDVNNFTSFEGYINNIGFKYMDNYSEIDVYQFSGARKTHKDTDNFLYHGMNEVQW
jgi:hypothetical protein